MVELFMSAEFTQKIITKSARETQTFASRIVRNLTRLNLAIFPHARVIALEGNLGAGKTTFVQGFAKALGVKENVLSPTFVFLKIYPLKKKLCKRLIHIDCYRLDSAQELLHLGFKNFLKDSDAIIVIEWADRVRHIIPRHATWITFRHLSPNQRGIIIRSSVKK